MPPHLSEISGRIFFKIIVVSLLSNFCFLLVYAIIPGTPVFHAVLLAGSSLVIWYVSRLLHHHEQLPRIAQLLRHAHTLDAEHVDTAHSGQLCVVSGAIASRTMLADMPYQPAQPGVVLRRVTSTYTYILNHDGDPELGWDAPEYHHVVATDAMIGAYTVDLPDALPADLTLPPIAAHANEQLAPADDGYWYLRESEPHVLADGDSPQEGDMRVSHQLLANDSVVTLIGSHQAGRFGAFTTNTNDHIHVCLLGEPDCALADYVQRQHSQHWRIRLLAWGVLAVMWYLWWFGSGVWGWLAWDLYRAMPQAAWWVFTVVGHGIVAAILASTHVIFTIWRGRFR